MDTKLNKPSIKIANAWLEWIPFHSLANANNLNTKFLLKKTYKLFLEGTDLNGSARVPTFLVPIYKSTKSR